MKAKKIEPPFARLKRLMLDNDVLGGDLAFMLGISNGALSKKLSLQSPFSEVERWKIMDIFHVPENELHLVFPRNGGL